MTWIETGGVLVVADVSDVIHLSGHVLNKNKSEGWENRLGVTRRDGMVQRVRGAKVTV